MKKKAVAIVLGIAILFSVGSFMSVDTQHVAMNKAEFVS